MKALKYLAIAAIVAISFVVCSSQTIYTYPLIDDFSAIEPDAPDLIQIPNNSGLTGAFVTRSVPASTCGEGGDAEGYYFEDDAGLQFNNPASFIDQSYSLAFNFQIDEFIVPPPWVRLLSFTHSDDIGVYIYLTNPPTNGTLEFWPYGTVGENNFFTTVDFYQLILVRTDDGLIKIFINGAEFAEYDDSGTQKFIPGEPNNYIVFFRDHPSVLANEASPGFVSDIIISNAAWTEGEVLEVWEDFCGSLVGLNENTVARTQIYPNPADDMLYLSFDEIKQKAEVQIFDLLGRMVCETQLQNDLSSVDISFLNRGLYFVKITQNNVTEVHKFEKD
jgi:hypothetical protein